MSKDNSDNQNWPSKPDISRKKILKNIKKAQKATVKHTHRFIIKRWENVRDVQSKVIFWIIIMGLLIAATALQMMWFQKSYLTTTVSNEGTYAEAVLGPLDTLNPILADSEVEQVSSYLIFSSLLKYDKSGHLNNDLAKKVTIDETGKIYTVTIRSDAVWHDGQKLTANDVAFTVELIKNDKTMSSISGWTNISVKVIGDYTIQFILPSVYASFIHALNFPILPNHILGKIEPGQIRENNFSQNPIGSGPFKFRFIQNVEDVSDQKIVYLARNNQYYGGKARLSKIQLNVYKTTKDIIKALSDNKVNATADLSSNEIKQVNLNKYAVSVKPIQSGVYALINTKSSLLGDVQLRRALQLATDTKKIISKLPQGTQKIDLPFTQNQLSGDVPSVASYNLELANKMLSDNGWLVNSNNYREKEGKELKISVIAMKGGDFEIVLEALSEQWRLAGFKIDAKIVDASDITQNVGQNILQPRNYDVLIYQLDIGADPDVYAYWASTQTYSSGLNFSNYSNIISDDALTSARSRIENNIRNAKYITFAKQWVNDVPAIGLYQSVIQYVYGKNMNVFDKKDILVSAVDRFSNILDWSIGSKTVYKTP